MKRKCRLTLFQPDLDWWKTDYEAPTTPKEKTANDYAEEEE